MARLKQIVALVMLHDHHRDVVELDRIGQRDQRAALRADRGRLVVIDPVADVSDAGGGEQVGGLQRLGQARPEPAHRPPSAEALQDVEAAPDGRGLIGEQVHRHLIVAVAHELPTGAPRLLGDARIVLADAGIDGERRPQRAAREQFEEPPGPHPHAVFVPAPVGNVGQQHLPGRRRQDLARHRPRDVPHLVIDDGPDHEPRAVRQTQRRPVHDGGEIATLARQHRGHGHSGLMWAARITCAQVAISVLMRVPNSSGVLATGS